MRHLQSPILCSHMQLTVMFLPSTPVMLMVIESARIFSMEERPSCGCRPRAAPAAGAGGGPGPAGRSQSRVRWIRRLTRMRSRRAMPASPTASSSRASGRTAGEPSWLYNRLDTAEISRVDFRTFLWRIDPSPASSCRPWLRQPRHHRHRPTGEASGRAPAAGDRSSRPHTGSATVTVLHAVHDAVRH